ncbi:HD-GYP domain-containing protein [uncultured Roseibium sp.]|uniref:HD-GYP domain-containing protein n=1 Tax=uncultured Roseibium sp. TaxID=1936171 RepID=UPI0032163A89
MSNSVPAHKIRLSELLGALSHALDMTEGQPRGHCVRCCWIGFHIGEAYGLSDEQLVDLYYTILLKDLGCSSNAARICELYLADDISLKQDVKLINGSLSAALRFVLSHTGLKSGLAERFRAIINILQNGGEITRELIETRCHRGADIARQMHFSQAVCDGIYRLDEHWDGSGKPDGVSGEDIPVFSRIALLSQVIDVFRTNAGPEAAFREIRARTGTWFDPRLTECFEHAAREPGFWQTLDSEDLGPLVYDLEPARLVRKVDEDQLDDIAAGFAQVIDSKSPYTAGHSERVTLFTDLIAEQLGYSEPDRRKLKRAALLHDIGKLGVSNMVLDKPGKLDEDEWRSIRLHPVYSDQILSQVAAFADLSAIARGHHERLDGKGYPDGLSGNEIGMDIRIVTTADIFDALTADRPYRAAMPIEKALNIMSEDIGTAIDETCFEGLRAALEKLGRMQAA